MPVDEINLETAKLIIAVAALGLFCLFVWPAIRLAIFRDELFEIRTRLFDAMVDAGKPFTDPAYVSLRDEINGTIRLAADLHPVTAYLLYRRIDHAAAEVERASAPADLTSDCEVRKIVSGASDEYARLTAGFLFLAHLTGWVLLIGLVVRAYAKRRRGIRRVFMDN